MPGRSLISSSEDRRYQLTGKERDYQTTGYDYFGARYYDSWQGRWLQVDPLANKYPGWSPYNYTLNNPLNMIDPNGSYTYEIDGVPIDQGLGGQLMQDYQQENFMTNGNKNGNGDKNNNSNDKPEINPKKIINNFKKSILTKLAALGNSIKNLKSKIVSISKTGYKYVYGYGPEYLNQVSEDVAAAGFVGGVSGSLTFGPEVGVLIALGAGGTSLVLDASATTITGIDYIVHWGDKAKLNRFFNQAIGGLKGEAVSKGVENGNERIGDIVNDLIEIGVETATY